jgi:hypothetical protein
MEGVLDKKESLVSKVSAVLQLKTVLLGKIYGKK